MGAPFWIRRYLLVFVPASFIIGGAQFMKGRTLHYSIVDGLIWGAITAAVYIIAARYRYVRGQSCAICPIPPETARSENPSSD